MAGYNAKTINLKQTTNSNITNYLLEYNNAGTYHKTIAESPNSAYFDGYSSPVILETINRKATDGVYVPDTRTWTDLGASTFYGTPILNYGNTLYAICPRASSFSNKIYTASMDSPTVWTDTGITMPATLGGPRIVRINDTYYMFGDQAGSNVMMTAPYSNPTSWTQIGNFPHPRHNADIAIYKDKILMTPGYNGGTSQAYVVYANVATPTVWNISTINISAWECGIMIANDCFRVISGCTNTYIKAFDASFNMVANVATENVYTTVPSVWETEVNKYYGFGFGNYGTTNSIRYLSPENYDCRLSLTYTLPGAISYIHGCEFIDNKGYLYIFGNNYRIYRSGRKLSTTPSKSVFTFRKSWLSYIG